MGGSLIPVGESKYFDRKQQKQNAKRDRRKRHLSSLAIPNIDAAIRQMHRAIGLTTKDREHLKSERGMTDEQIEKGLYFSLEPRQELPKGIPANFPGVDRYGERLTNQYKGIACVTFNPKGLATGIQYRLVDDTGTGRYRWVSCETNRVHLSNGELPLTYIRPSEIKNKNLVLVEGTGFKPRIAADRLGQLVVGAGGGQHAGSPQQLKEFITTAGNEGYDTSVVEIALDAGDAINYNVMHRISGLVSLLESWGKAVEFLWWEQSFKTADDIDELEDLSAIERIPASAFEPLTRFRADRPLVDEEPPITEPSPEAYKQYVDREEALEKQAELEAQRQEDIWWDNLIIALKNAWRRKKKFKPDEIIDKEYFDFPFDKLKAISAIKSPVGSGKSEFVKRLLKYLAEVLGEEGAVALGYRNSLLLNLCARWGFYHLHKDNAFGLVADPNSKIACCVDSLERFQPHDFEGKSLILDEVMSILLHLLAGNTIKGSKRQRCLELFKEAVRLAKRIILLDGHLADWAVDYIKELSGGKEVIKIENRFVNPIPLEIQLFSGSCDGDKKIRKRDKSPLVNLLLEDCAPNAGLRVAIATDSQIFAEAIDKILLSEGYTGIRVDSITISEDYCKDFLENPNQWLEKKQTGICGLFTYCGSRSGYFD